MANQNEFSPMQRYVLKRAHPHRILYDVVAWMWGVHFLWNGNWQMALVTIVGLSVLGLYFSKDANPNEIAKTPIGKMALLHLHPYNLALQIPGLVLSIVGVAAHQTQLIMAGLSLLVLGHFFGWSRVHEAFKIEPSSNETQKPTLSSNQAQAA